MPHESLLHRYVPLCACGKPARVTVQPQGQPERRFCRDCYAAHDFNEVQP
jgi:hypothetical protein